MSGVRLEWVRPFGAGWCVAAEPTMAQVRAASGLLAEAYNEPHNARMLGHDEAMTPADVEAYYAGMWASGARTFFFWADGVLVGDGDFRNFDGDAAEFAFMISRVANQGQGLGTMFARALHAWAFTTLPLTRLAATIAAYNQASLRVFAKLGYLEDASAWARGFAETPDDVVMSISRDVWHARQAELGVSLRHASLQGMR